MEHMKQSLSRNSTTVNSHINFLLNKFEGKCKRTYVIYRLQAATVTAPVEEMSDTGDVLYNKGGNFIFALFLLQKL